MGKTFIFIGRSGSGKGTQVDRLIERIKEGDSEAKFFRFESGAKLREFMAEDGYTNRLVKARLDEGKLAPTFLATSILAEALVDNISGGENLIFDGFPRSKRQARILDDALHFYGVKSPQVIYINLSPESAIERLKSRARGDDLDIQHMQNKMDWFDEKVLPMVAWYSDHDYYTFHEIDGEPSVDDVEAQIVAKLGLS